MTFDNYTSTFCKSKDSNAQYVINYATIQFILSYTRKNNMLYAQ